MSFEYDVRQALGQGTAIATVIDDKDARFIIVRCRYDTFPRPDVYVRFLVFDVNGHRPKPIKRRGYGGDSNTIQGLLDDLKQLDVFCGDSGAQVVKNDDDTLVILTKALKRRRGLVYYP